MNDLIYSISSELDQVAAPSCATPYGERVEQIILSKTVITAAGNVPTPEEIAEHYDDGGGIIIRGITNGHRIKQSDTEIDIAGYTERYDPYYRVEGNIKLVTETLARAVEKINFYKNLYFYFITDKYYCFGPYDSYPYFTLIQFSGKGTPPMVKFTIDYYGGGIDHSNYDADYADLFNIVTLRADMTTITTDSTVITADQI